MRPVAKPLVALVLVIAGLGPGLAQEKPAPKAPEQPAARDKPWPVSANRVLLLVKNSIIAVNQANLANDYSVLYKLAAPGFQKENPEAKLAEIFAKFREAKLDLAPIVLSNPKVRPPELTEKGFLRIAGFFETKPVSINFDTLYEKIDGDWKLYGISLRPERADALADKAQPKAEPEPAKTNADAETQSKAKGETAPLKKK